MNARERRKDGNPHTHLTDTSGGAPGDPARQAPGRTAAGGARYSQQRILHQGLARAAGRQGQSDRGPGGPSLPLPAAPSLHGDAPGRVAHVSEGSASSSACKGKPGGPEHHPQGPLFQAKHTRCRKPAKPPWPKAAKPHCRSVPVLPLLSAQHSIE